MSAPERIYLQDAGDYSKAAAFEVTWCVEPQDDGDTGYVRADAVAEMIRQAVTAEREAMMEIVHPAFIWGALDNVHDCDTTLDDYADAVSRAQTSAIRARGEG